LMIDSLAELPAQFSGNDGSLESPI
jgi:hypothetical protein